MVAESGMEIMGKRPFLAVLCFGCAMLVGSSSWAATIEPGQGDLSVNQGKGYQPINSRVDACVGDTVMVGPGGAATVVYDDGCKVDIQPGSVTTIAPLSPCASGSYAQDNKDNGYGPYIMGGVVIGVGVLAGIAASNSNKSNSSAPASP